MEFSGQTAAAASAVQWDLSMGKDDRYERRTCCDLAAYAA